MEQILLRQSRYLAKVLSQKFLITFNILLVVFLLTSCATTNSASKYNADIIVDQIGKPKVDAVNKLNIDPEKDLEILENYPEGVFRLKTKEKFLDDEYDVFLSFFGSDNTFYRWEYMYIDDIKQAYKRIEKLKKYFNKEYGEPSTYPTLDTRFKNMPTIEELLAKTKQDPKGQFAYFDTWELGDAKEVSLDFEYFPEEEQAKILIIYQNIANYEKNKEYEKNINK